MLLIGSIILILICAVGILKYIFIYRKKNKRHQLPDVEKLSTREYKVKNKTIATKVGSNALKVISNLSKHGYQAYLVGGCIRDILLGLTPKDFDIVTDATPEQILKLFKNARLIGRRFKLIHVTFGRDIIEVATFRATNLVKNHQTKSGRLLFDNNYGTIEEDAMRRDFTINAIYYDHQTEELIDFCNGIDDLDNGILKLIGDPSTRYQEDPVRMIRAIKFSCRLNISMERQTQKHIPIIAHLLDDVPPGRKYNEIIKLLYTGCIKNIFDDFMKFDLFRYLFPAPYKIMHEDEIHRKIVNQALINTDTRINNGENRITCLYIFYFVVASYETAFCYLCTRWNACHSSITASS